MAKTFVSLFCSLSIIVLTACNSSAESTDIPAVVIPSGTPIVSTPVLSTFTPVVSSTVTLDAEITASSVTLSPTYEECSQGRYFTELGNWALCHPLADPITIINASNEIRQFSYNDYYGGKIANPCTRLHHITEDGKYLYFSLDEDCILTEPGFITSIGLFRMDLTNGKVSETLPASYNFESNQGLTYSVSISPTGRRLAYIAHKKPPLSLNILDMQTGQSNSYELDEKYIDGGSFIWSEDGTKLTFMLSREENYEILISMAFMDMLKENSLVNFANDQSYEWIISNVEFTESGIKISPPGDEPLFYEFDTGILGPIK